MITAFLDSLSVRTSLMLTSGNSAAITVPAKATAARNVTSFFMIIELLLFCARPQPRGPADLTKRRPSSALYSRHLTGRWGALGALSRGETRPHPKSGVFRENPRFRVAPAGPAPAGVIC